MEIVNCIGFKQAQSPLDSLSNFFENFAQKINIHKKTERFSKKSKKRSNFYARTVYQKSPSASAEKISSFNFSAFLQKLGSFVTLAEENAKIILTCIAATISAVLLFICIFKATDYFQTKAGKVTLENNYDSEMQMLTKLMNAFALDETSEYSADGTLIGEELSPAEMEKLFSQPVTFQTYKVQSGDSISSITKKFGLSNISTLIAVNDIENVRKLREGQKLKIPSIDGLFYTVQNGNTLQGLSSKYNVTLEDLLDVNELETSELSVGQVIFIPGAKLDSKTLSQAMGELFKNPLNVRYKLSSRFGPRADPFTGTRSNHTGIDMACPTGTPIMATASGTITYSGTSPVFGYYVIINHGNGYQSLYGHMSKILVKKGQWVSQGTRIGLVGSTGYSTGPHLHFTVFKNGKLVDPLTLIK